MKYFLDTEFIDNGKTIDLISVGLVSENGREIYLQSIEFNLQDANSWVKENVLAHMPLCPHVNSHGDTPLEALDANKFEHPRGQCLFERHARAILGSSAGGYLTGAHTDCFWRTREQMAREVKLFFDPHKSIEIWGWCAGYDFVALCQLFGTMMDLPKGWPHYIHDLQHVLDERSILDEELPAQENDAHNALADAKHIKKLWEYVTTNNIWT